MLPATQASVVSQMHGTYPRGRQTTELGRYLRLEYGASAGFADSMIDQAVQARLGQTRRASLGAIRRFLAAIFGPVGAAHGMPEGA